VGISLNADWYEAKPSSDAAEAKRNVKAAERAMEFTLGWFARPLYQVGGAAAGFDRGLTSRGRGVD
jgi:hypothetical protein